MAGPQKQAALQGARDHKGEVGGSSPQLFRADEVEKKVQSLLRNVFTGKSGLLLGNPANRTMQHWKESKNEKHLDRLGFRLSGGEERSKDLVRAGVRLRAPQVGQQGRHRWKSSQFIGRCEECEVDTVIPADELPKQVRFTPAEQATA